MKTLTTLWMLVAMFAVDSSTFAATNTAAPAVAPSTLQTVLPSANGEVRKIDLENKKNHAQTRSNYKLRYAWHDHGFSSQRPSHTGKSQSG